MTLTGFLATLPLYIFCVALSGQTPSPQLVADYGKLPLSFEPNQGQTNPDVKFVSRGAGYTLFLNPSSATFSLGNSSVVRMDLLGSNATALMEASDKLPGVSNYLMGSTRTKWPSNLPTYARTRSRNIYPGIDLIYYGTQGHLEYDFVVAPRADVSLIRLKFAGASPVVNASGDLVLSVGDQNDIRFRKPVLYQQIEGVRKRVCGRFVVAANTREVRFQTGWYDHSRELVIDPVLVFSSFLGGSTQQSVINGMALNAAGQIYVTGVTNAVDYPTTPGVIQPTCPAPMTGSTKCGVSSSSAAFVSKISADGKSLIYSTYLGGGGAGPGVGGANFSQGGSGSDIGNSVAVDANDNAWVVGQTNSNNFPVTADAYSLYCQPVTNVFDFNTNLYTGELSGCARYNGGGEYVYSGNYSLFLVKLNPTGTSILYGTFFGGYGGESASQVALDTTGKIYISGSVYTFAVGLPQATGQFIFPTTASAFQPVPQPNAFSPFVSEFSPDGKQLLYSSFLSAAAGNVFGSVLAVNAGKVFIGGYAQTPSFPTTPGAFSNTCPGTATQCPNNAIVAEFDTTRSGAASLVFSTYLNGKHLSTAGTGFDSSIVSAMAADAAGNVYVGGSTQYIDFPTTPGSLQPNCFSGTRDFCSTGFVTKLNAAGGIVWSTYYGSPSANGQYGVAALAIDSSNDVYVANLADGAGDLPLNNGFQGYTSGVAYVTELSSDGSKVLFGSFFGNAGNVYPTALAVDASRNIYLAGYASGGLPLVNAFQSTNGGGFNEGFFVKIAGAPSSTEGQGVFVSSASGQVTALASGSIVTVYGVDLATGTAAGTLPLPTNLLGTTVTIVDSTGVSTAAPLFFVSPGQINFQVPQSVATGVAYFTITSGDGTKSVGAVTLAAVAPGLFLLNTAALVAANTLTVDATGAQTYGNDFQVVNGAVVPLPVNVSASAGQVFLVLYGTGISGRSSLSKVTVSIGGMSLPVAYAGPSGEVGLDQVNVQIPASLAGTGNTPITVTVDGVVSNTGNVTIL